MEGSRFRAGVELDGQVMRYAEIELGGRGTAGPRLLRLGACDFDFDVAEAILDLSGPTHLDTVATAVREIFEGSASDRLVVGVHPWNATAFFSPVLEGAPPVARLEQFRQEAALLADVTASRPVRVRPTPVRIEAHPDGNRYHWHHVLHMPESVHARLEHLAKPFRTSREGGHAFVDATGAAAAIAARVVTMPEDEEPPFALSVGVYSDRTEFALSQGDTWHYGHHVEADVRVDGVYFAGAMLGRLGLAPSEIGHLFVYGAVEADTASTLSDWLGVEAQPLDPLKVFGLTPTDADPYGLAAYVPCVGALLR